MVSSFAKGEGEDNYFPDNYLPSKRERSDQEKKRAGCELAISAPVDVSKIKQDKGEDIDRGCRLDAKGEKGCAGTSKSMRDGYSRERRKT